MFFLVSTQWSICHCFLILLVISYVDCSYPLNDAAETINEMGSSIQRVMGGTSGILYFSIRLNTGDIVTSFCSLHWYRHNSFLYLNSYNIFCKAAYAKLKVSSKPVTAKECEFFFSRLITRIELLNPPTFSCSWTT